MLVALLSIFGNALVTLTFLRDRTLRTPTNVFVFSLAVTDLLTSAVASPLYVRAMITRLPHDFRACVCVHSLILTFCTVSIFHLIAVSFDRYMAIVFRRKPCSHEQGMRRAGSYVACAWILGILVGCMPVMGWNAGNELGPDIGNVAQCDFMKVISMRYLMFLFYSTIVAPTVVMTFFYGSIYYAVRKQQRRMLNARFSLDSRSSIVNNDLMVKRKTTTGSSAALISEQSLELDSYQSTPLTQHRSSSVPSVNCRAATWQKRQNAKTKKIVFSLVLVIICFFVSWYPLYIMNAVAYYCETCRIEGWWFYAPIILSHLSSVMNPFIYARTMPGYKEAFIETLTCGKVIPEPVGYQKRRSALITDFDTKKPNITRQQAMDGDDLRVM